VRPLDYCLYDSRHIKVVIGIKLVEIIQASISSPPPALPQCGIILSYFSNIKFGIPVFYSCKAEDRLTVCLGLRFSRIKNTSDFARFK